MKLRDQLFPHGAYRETCQCLIVHPPEARAAIFSLRCSFDPSAASSSNSSSRD